MKLVLVRHGESMWNRNNLFTGWTDVDLSEKGVEEAKAAGRLLLDSGFDFDLCYTSCLRRAICTLGLILLEMDRLWLPVSKAWQLNERHYGALQGLDKAETARRYGDEQVKIWRRSYSVRPPALSEEDPTNPRNSPAYRGEDPALLPLCESLEDTLGRVRPYYENVIKPDILAGRRVLISAHGNSLRALVKLLDGLSDNEIMELNIPTGSPLVYELDEKGNSLGRSYLRQ